MLTRLATPTTRVGLNRRALATTTEATQADADGDRRQRQAVAEELGVARRPSGCRAGCAARRSPTSRAGRRAPGTPATTTVVAAAVARAGPPSAQAQRLDAGAWPPDSPKRARPRRMRSRPMANRANTSTSVAISLAASRSYVPRQMRNTPTVTVSRLKYCTVREVGQRLHRHDRRAGGDRRPQHRHDDAAGRLATRRAERAGDERRRRRLVAQRRAGQQVHVRVQRQRERDDRAGHRADLREPGVAPELVAPPRLDGPATPNTAVVTKPRM